MYIVYLDKKNNSKMKNGSFVSQLLRKYLLFTNANSMIVSPGYPTSNSTSQDFINKFFNNINLNYFGILDGMTNSSKYLPGKSNSYFFGTQVNQFKKYSIITFKSAATNLAAWHQTNRDHRKMVFIGNYAGKNNYINNKNYSAFANAFNTCAVMLGSSNFSYTTYFGTKSGTADKGESDVFIFNDKNFYDLLIGEQDAAIANDINEFNNDINEFNNDINEFNNNFYPNILISEVHNSALLNSNNQFFNSMLESTLHDALV